METQGEKRNKPQDFREMLLQWGFSEEASQSFDNEEMKQLLWMAYQMSFAQKSFFSREDWDTYVNERLPGVDPEVYLRKIQGMITENLNRKNYPLPWFLEKAANIRDLLTMMSQMEGYIFQLQEREEKRKQREELIQELQAELQEKDKEQENLSLSLSDLNRAAQLAESQRKYAELEKDNLRKSLNEEIARLNKELENLKRQHEMRGEETELQGGLKEHFEKELLDARNRNQEFSNNLTKVNEEKGKLEEEVRYLKEALNLSQGERQDLAQQVENLRKEIGELNRENDNLEAKGNHLEQELKTQTGRVESLNKDLRLLRNNLDRNSQEVKDQFMEYEQNIRELEGEIARLSEEVGNLETEKQIAEEGLKKAEEKMEEMGRSERQTLDYFKEEARRLTEEVRILRHTEGESEEVKVLREELEKARENLISAEERNVKILAEKQNVERRLGVLQKKTQERKDTVGNLAKRLREIIESNFKDVILEEESDPNQLIGVLQRAVARERVVRETLEENLEEIQKGLREIIEALKREGHRVDASDLALALSGIKEIIRNWNNLKKDQASIKEMRESEKRETVKKLEEIRLVYGEVLEVIEDKEGVPRPSINAQALKEKLSNLEGALVGLKESIAMKRKEEDQENKIK